LGELSQHPTCPHSTHIRRCTQVPPLARHSWHPGWFTLEIRIWSRWVQVSAMVVRSGIEGGVTRDQRRSGAPHSGSPEYGQPLGLSNDHKKNPSKFLDILK
jgi:hypothetical protein